MLETWTFKLHSCSVNTLLLISLMTIFVQDIK